MTDFIPGYTQCYSAEIIELADRCLSVLDAEQAAAIVVEADRLQLQINSAIDQYEQALKWRRKFMSKPPYMERMTREEVRVTLQLTTAPTWREIDSDDSVTVFQYARYRIAQKHNTEWRTRVRRLLKVARAANGPHLVNMDLMHFMVTTGS